MIDLKSIASREKKTVDHLVRALREVTGVQAIVLGGSRSRGHIDEHSDIDIGVLSDSGLVDESYLRAVSDLATGCRDRFVATPSEFGFHSDKQQWVEIHCASTSEWEEALRICKADPGSAEPWHLEMLQICHFLLPLFDPEDKAKKLKQEAQTQSDHFWWSYGKKYLQECYGLIARFGESETMPPLARAIFIPRPLYSVFRTLGAINRCFYFGGWQMEDYIGRFRFGPQGVQERLARCYRLAQYSSDLMERQTDDYRALVLDISRLFWGALAPRAAAVGLDRETKQLLRRDAAHRKAEEELFSVSSRLQSRDHLLCLSAYLSRRVHTPPGEINKYTERGAFCFYQDLLRDMIGSLVEVLLATNGIGATPVLKLDETIGGLPIQPQNAYARILEILHCANPADTLAPLEVLTRETETIVQAKEPAADVYPSA